MRGLIKVKIKKVYLNNYVQLSDLVHEKALGSTYVLLIFIAQFQRLLIGKLGWIDFGQGYYIYIGSARRTIQSRLLRHLAQGKNRFWHIDYLLSSPSSATITNIWINPKPCECVISQQIFQHEIGVIVRQGFGSSDCGCSTHLLKVSSENLILLHKILTQNRFYSLLELDEKPDK